MVSFINKTARVNEMGGKYYVEVKVKTFERGTDGPVSDTTEVEIYDDAESVSNFLDNF